MEMRYLYKDRKKKIKSSIINESDVEGWIDKNQIKKR